MRWVALLFLVGCHAPAPRRAPAEPITLTYLGVAGWQIEGGGHTVLADPYFSRPVDDGSPIAPDEAAIAAHAPAKADLVFVGHSHHDHLLDAPAVALRTGAQLLGSATTAHVARASGVPDDHLITVKGGEDFEFDGFSVRVIPSLHSAIGDKHIFGGALDADPTLPMPASSYPEGGTFAYDLRIAGHEILVLDTANYIERELEGLRPDIAIVGVGLREQIHDYTCKLMRALGNPPRVYASHFDDWKGPPVDEPISEDLQAFVDEVHRCSPDTEVLIPKHFDPMRLAD